MLSVVVPVYDVADYLAECLDSILAQPVELEVVAVDDASTDGSAGILADYAARDPRVRVVTLAVNGGLGAARNTGLSHVRGEYVLFVDSDDVLVPGALAELDLTADVVLFGFERFWPDGRIEVDARSAALLEPAAVTTLAQRPELLEVFPSAWNKAYRTAFARRFRFAEGFYEDIPWTFPVLVTAASIATMPRVLYRYRQRAGSILASSGERHLQLLDRFDETFAYLDEHPELGPWRVPLFERMTRHVPTVLETSERIPPATRRVFYDAASAAFRRHRPPGYRAHGAAAVKIGLVERGVYPAFRAAQLANAAARRARDQVFPPAARSGDGNRPAAGKTRSLGGSGSGDVLMLAAHVPLPRTVDLDDDPAGIDPALGLGARRIEIAERIAGQERPVVRLRPAHGHAVPAEPDWTDPARYLEIPRRWATLVATDPPRWLQRLLLAELLAYLAADSGMYTATAALPVELTDAFHALLPQLAAAIDDDLIAAAPAPEEHRLALLLGAQGRTGHGAVRVNRDRNLVRSRVFYAGAAPTAEGKRRDLTYFGRVLLHERIVWADAPVVLDGAIALPPDRRESRAGRVRRILTENHGVAHSVARDLRIRRAAARTNRYDGAWLLMDRDTAAGDNAEHLYRYVRDRQDAYFVLARDSRDWPRLEQDGFRLLEYGSDEHFVALLQCAHLISSQVDSYVVKPFRRHLLGPGRFRYTFLQHGVTKDDLSRWLDGKPIDLMITATPDEQESIVGDGSGYVLTGLETKLTGFARHDRLLSLAGTPRTRLLVMPTWRRELLGAQAASNRRELLDGFWETPFARGWRALLEDDRLHELGWEPVFVPHPNLEPYLDTSPLRIPTLRFGEIDVQEVLASAAVVITDYSSLAFEAAYLERPVVYYQFDADDFFAGGHVYRRGTWSYERQGFGPVTTTVDGVLNALGTLGEDEYLRRMRDTFPFRDGRCCERIVDAILSI